MKPRELSLSRNAFGFEMISAVNPLKPPLDGADVLSQPPRHVTKDLG